MSNRRRIYGLWIEGYPGDDAAAADGVAYYYGDHTPHASSDYNWTPGLAEIPRSVDTKIDPVTGDWSVSALSFRLDASDAIATALLRTEVDSDNAVSSALDSTTTTLATSSSVSGSVVYVGDETMRITSGSNPYTVTRGAYGSTAEAHAAGAIVTEHPAYWVPRRVAFILHDVDTGADAIVWSGYLDKIQTTTDGASIVVQCSEAWSRLRQAKGNRAALDLNAARGARVTRGRLEGLLVHDGSTWRDGLGYVAVQVGDAVVRCHQSSDGVIMLAARDTDTILGSVLALPEQEGAYLDPCYELLVWDRLGDAGAPAVAVSPGSGAYQFHPLYIARSLLDGTLGDHWSLAATGLDFTSFDDAISDNPELQIDYLILGWNGAPIEPFKIAERLMRAYGYHPTISEAGAYGIARARALDLATVDAIAEVSPYNDGDMQMLPAYSQGVSEITSVTGERPWLPGARRTVLSRGGSRRGTLIQQRRQVEYAIDFLTQDKADKINQQLAAAAAIVHFDLPRIRVRVPDSTYTGTSHGLGQYVKLADLGELVTAWFVTADGERVTDFADRVDVIGQITARKRDFHNSTDTLELMLWAYRTNTFTRERAPSAVVKSHTSGQIDTVIGTFTDDDASYFVAGDELQICDRTGARVSTGTAPTVTGVSGNAITYSGSFGITPSAGQIVRLAPSDEYANTTRYSGYARPYLALADGSDQIDTPSGTDDADTYGGGLGVSF